MTQLFALNSIFGILATATGSACLFFNATELGLLLYRGTWCFHAMAYSLVLSLWLCVCGNGPSQLNIFSQFGQTMLMRAAEKGLANCARLLLDAGADKNATNKVRVGRVTDL